MLRWYRGKEDKQAIAGEFQETFVTLMPLVLVVVLALGYGLAWHNHSAKSGQDFENPHVSENTSHDHVIVSKEKRD